MTERDDALDARLATLAERIEPERDLWPEIEAALPAPRQSFWQWRVAASGIAAALFIGLLIGRPVGDRPLVADQVPTAVPHWNSELVRHASFDDAFMRDYERALASLSDQLNSLPPGTRDVVIGNLKIIRESINEINAAIDREPNNVQLRQLLQLAYRQEMAVVSSVRDSASTVRRVRTTL